MTMRKIVMLGLVLAGTTLGPAAAQVGGDAELRLRVKRKVEALNTALIRGEYDKLADLTHPNVVEENGGRAKMIESMKLVVEELKSTGVAIRGVKVETPREFVKAGRELFTVVRFSMEITGPGVKLTQSSFVIGVSADTGKTWTFINGDLGEAAVKRLLPNLPERLTLPGKQLPVVEKTR
jgi:hypothetical protein